MKTGNAFYDNYLPKEEQKQYALLFKDKDKRDFKCDKFHSTLEKFIQKQESTTKTYVKEYDYDLSCIKFDSFFSKSYFAGNFIEDDIDFSDSIFYDDAHFCGTNFGSKTNFNGVDFQKEVYFEGAIFNKETFFNNCKFGGNVYFEEATFNNEVHFNNVTVKKTIDLSRVHFEEFFDASGMSFNKINLKGTYFESPLLLGLSACENGHKVPLEPRHFANKESARLIKDHFEKQNNITEANKYFRIEQDKYLEELKSDWYWKNKGDIAVVFLNKIISNHQTSWLKVLFTLCIYAFIIFAGYEYFKDFSTLKQGFLASLNKAIELIDPLNMFKRDNNLFENHQALGFAIRIFSLYLFWQFITAFRQNTRRK
jgi:hypothetical protein